MTTAEALKRIEQMKLELEVLRSVLTPAKPRKRTRKDYTRQIQKSILKTPGIYKNS